jgi:alpha-galactosidase
MPQTAHAPEHRLWVLTAADASYVLHLGPDDLPRGLHWGRVLTLDQAVTLLDDPPPSSRSFEDPSDGMLDLSAAGALRYAHAGLQVRFADGTRDLELSFTGHRVEEHGPDDEELVLSFADSYFPLAVESHYRIRADNPAIERHLTLRHTGDGAEAGAGAEPLDVLHADSASWVIPPLAGYRFSHAYGQWSAELQLQRSPLAFGETVLGSRRGVTSHHANPWAMIDAGDATEEHGAVYGAALAWSGNWQLVAERVPTDRVSVSLGASHDPEVRTLAPGEELTTPPSVGMYTEGGFGAASRAWHDYIRAHVVPHPDELRPVLYNSWEATWFDVGVKGQKALADRAAALGVELFVMDDGWFGRRVDDHAGLGDWTPNPERFPDGLGPLIDHVHGLGMKFGLWVEPEMTNPDSDLYRAHPDWIIARPHRDSTQSRHQYVLNLARRDVADWMHAMIDLLVRENAIDFLKWDMNRPLTEVGPIDGRTDDYLRSAYVANLYGVLDRLRADHPGLRIENCSSGGGRVDLGILARTDQTWTSDNTDAVDRLSIQHGYSQLYPAQTMAAWVTDVPNPFTRRETPLEYRGHVAAAGVFAVGMDLAACDDAELARLSTLIERYKAVRPLVQHGVQYRLGGEPARGDGGLTAIQYVARDGGQTVVLAFLNSRRYGRAAPVPVLRGLDPQASYRDAETGRVHHGAVLLARGLPLDLPAGEHASTMIHLRRVGLSEEEPLTSIGVNQRS